jgi:DNA-binding CsgD family transcriptional regulator
MSHMEQPPTREVVLHPLSQRELEVLTWAAEGKTYRDISVITGYSYGTIKTRLDCARYKLNAVNVSHAVAKAITLGLISIRT